MITLREIFVSEKRTYLVSENRGLFSIGHIDFRGRDIAPHRQDALSGKGILRPHDDAP